MSKSLAGKVAVVTGSTQGLGAAIATLYVKEGAKVILSGRSAKNGGALAKKLGKNAVYVESDLVRVDDCRKLVDTAMKRFGGVDILVNNAVDSSRATVDDVTPEFFDRLFALNVRAPLMLSHYAIASLRKRKGVIVNIGSVNAFMGEPRLLVYAATKGALADRVAQPGQLSQVRSRPRLLPQRWLDGLGRRASDDDAARPLRRLHRSRGKELAARADPEAGRSGGGRHSSSPRTRERHSAGR